MMTVKKKTRLPNSEWHLEGCVDGWHLHPPNAPYFFLGVWTEKQARTISAFVEGAYHQGADDVREAIRDILGITGGL